MRQCTKLLRATLTALLLPLALAGATVGGPLEDAAAAHQHGDYATAYRLTRPLAEQGNADAQTSLGAMYGKGEGVPQNYSEAVRLYRLVADEGNATAQSNLGLMYAQGHGVPQDYVIAHMWLNLSAAQGYEDAVKNRDVVAHLMTSEQIAEAQKLAREWKPKPER
jgi:TPR repeat protein